MTKSQERRAKHKAQFAKIGAAISAMKSGDDYDGRDYYTGRAVKFCPVIVPIDDPAISSHLFGPQTMSQQFERTVRK